MVDTDNAKRRKVILDSFNRFTENPWVAMAMSSIPPSENPDALRTLMRATFEAGIALGEASVLGHLIRGAFQDKDKN